jgi:hypothetical protein
MTNDLARLLDRILELIDAPAEGAPEPLLATIEHTLTDGYALALALEAEGLRIEREIGEVLARIKRGEGAGDLVALTNRLSHTESELARLRDLLNALRRRADRVRVDAADATRRSRFGRRRQPPGYGYRSVAS